MVGQGKVEGRDEVAYVMGIQMEVADDGNGEGDEVANEDGVHEAFACEEEKDTVGERHLGEQKEGHALIVETAGAVEENQIVVDLELLVAAEQMPLLQHNREVAYP